MKVVEVNDAKQVTVNEPQEVWVVIPFHTHGIKKITDLTATLDTTAVPGILTNSTDDPIASNNQEDYSFNPHEDCKTAILDYDGTKDDPGLRQQQNALLYCFYYDDTPVHPEAHGAIVLKVWCKDFGGNCEISFSGMAELWGVPGTIDFSELKVEIPFTTRNAPQEADPYHKWKEDELGKMKAPGNTPWGKAYGTNFEYWRKRLLRATPAEAKSDDKTDKEPAHPGNPYPADFPCHLIHGDSLNLWQEYRGFDVSGGGFDADGMATIPPMLICGFDGRVRLSPAIKELLVQVDVMKGIKDFGWGGAASLMDDVSKKFSDRMDGAGIRLYWLLHEKEALPSQVFETISQRKNWGTSHRNLKELPEYVHLSFAKCQTFGEEKGAVLGHTTGYGSFVYIERSTQVAGNKGYTLNFLLVRVASHEITHMLLKERREHEFNANEHLYKTEDEEYLMFGVTTKANANLTIFSNKTRARLNLRSKETVERFAPAD